MCISAEEYKELLRKSTTQSDRKANFPRRFKARLLTLHYFQVPFDSSETYGEPQVNATMQRRNIFEVDHFQIRRYLGDSRMNARSVDGEEYSLSEAFSALANWDFVVSVTDTKPWKNIN
ncbi:MAG TPA: hypothetical protein DCF78_05680 [Dehalococcoidia bacterium]|nr:hypothetical protein [Dehalococcoidia bacterium]